MLVPSTKNPEDIICNTQELEEYITARDPPVHYQSQAAKLPTQLNLTSDRHKDGIEQPMEVSEGVLSLSKLQSLLLNELNQIEATQIKEVMMQSIE